MKKSELLKHAEEIGLEVDPSMKIAGLKRRIAEQERINEEAAAREVIPEETVTVRLLNHYRPSGWTEIVGHKDQDGNIVPGMADAPVSGANADGITKIWAGTIVKMGKAEARRLVENTVSEIEVVRDPVTKTVLSSRPRKRRIALAEIEIDWNAATA